LRGCGRIPPAAKNNENRAFRPKTATVTGYDRLLFQLLMRQIRYSADQWNFFADQRILRALSIEEQRNSRAVRGTRIEAPG
jgi:hypothetical protein